MRLALAAAVPAACLLATCATADVMSPVAAVAQFASIPTVAGTLLHSETPLIGSTLRLAVDMVARAGDRLGGGRRLRLQSSTLNFYPFESGFRLTLGAKRDRSARVGLRGLYGRSERVGSFGGGMGFNGRQRISPGVGVGYDAALDRVTRVSFDGGLALQHRDAGVSRLLKLANLGDRSNLLAAPAARFGATMRVRLIRSF